MEANIIQPENNVIPPEIKINMALGKKSCQMDHGVVDNGDELEEVMLSLSDNRLKLFADDIIRIEGKKLPISHNLYKRKPFYKNFRRNHYKRFYRKRRYLSQNWRLRSNGPGSAPGRYKLRAFLERKWRTTPYNSVFHRLGYNSVAKAKLWEARNYTRPNTYRKWMPHVQRDPHRLQKLYASQRHYTSKNILQIDPSELPPSSEPVKPLNKINLAQLRDILGGQITQVAEATSETGTVTTTITRVASFDSRSRQNFANTMNNSVQNQFPMGGSFSLRNQFDNTNQNRMVMSGVNSESGNTMAGTSMNRMGFSGFNNGFIQQAVFTPNMNRTNVNLQDEIAGIQQVKNDLPPLVVPVPGTKFRPLGRGIDDCRLTPHALTVPLTARIVNSTSDPMEF
ncbi:hypothetical protein FOCC_FOCC003925 [Frankliniella occidentalis]|nr:hypothetical protein FOCC_FOCC003925 [Frankliniella occidentalis]